MFCDDVAFDACILLVEGFFLAFSEGVGGPEGLQGRGLCLIHNISLNMRKKCEKNNLFYFVCKFSYSCVLLVLATQWVRGHGHWIVHSDSVNCKFLNH